MNESNYFDFTVNNFKALIAAQNDEIMRLRALALAARPDANDGSNPLVIACLNSCLDLALEYAKCICPIKENICRIADEVWEARKGENNTTVSDKRAEAVKRVYSRDFLVLGCVVKTNNLLIQRAHEYLSKLENSRPCECVGLTTGDVKTTVELVLRGIKDFQFDISLLAGAIPGATAISATATAIGRHDSVEAEALVEIYWFQQSRFAALIAQQIDAIRAAANPDSTRAHSTSGLIAIAAELVAVIHLAQAGLATLQDAIASLAPVGRVADLLRALTPAQETLVSSSMSAAQLCGRK